MSARQRLIVLFSLFALSVLLYSSPAHAVLTDPHEDQGIYLSQRFMQWDSPWKFDYYAGKEITENGKVIGKYMKDHGCLVTSFAMLFNYYGLMHIPDVSNNYAPKINPICIDPAIPDYQRWELCRYWGLYLKNEPRTLNTWLTENNIYVERRTTKKGKPYVEDLLNSETVAKKFWVRYQGAGMYNYYVEPQNSCQPVNNRANCYEMPWSSSAETLLDIDILNKKPAIMLLSWTDSDGTPHPGHFVLIGGYSESDTSYRAYDPNQYYNRQEMYPPGLNKLYSDGKEGHTKLRINRFKAEYYVYPYQPDMSFISILGMSPIEMQIIDPHGNATGLAGR